MKIRSFSAQGLILISFAAIYIIWGTTYIAILVGLEDIPPFLMASIRFAMAGVLLVGWCILRKEPFPTISSIAKNSLLGLVILVGGQSILIWSEQYIPSGYAAILAATLPIWFVVIDRGQWKNSFSNKFIIGGLILGFLGIILLFQEHLANPFPSEQTQMGIFASAAVLFGCICWAGGSLYHRYWPSPGSIMSNLGWQLLCGAVIAFSISYFSGELHNFSITEIGPRAWFAVSYLAIAGSIIAFIAYSWLLTQKPSAVVGTYAYINPVIAVLLGWILADEIISGYQLTGMMIILVSAMMINFSKSKKLKLQRQ